LSSWLAQLLETIAAPVGYGSLVVLVIWSIITGRLVPGKERDLWMNAYFQEKDNSKELLETARLLKDVLEKARSSAPATRRPRP
jgi:hypothetical protein